jgi:hypothetical protein
MTRALFALFVLFTMAGGAAHAGDYYYGDEAARPWAGHLPSCDEPSVVGRVVEKFAYYDFHVMQTGLAVERIDHIRQSGLDAGGPSLVDRRYCSATAWLSDGRKTEAVYLIESRQGFASIGWNVESCLTGYDPYRVHDGRCRSIRP